MSTVYGIDGSKNGWCVASFNSHTNCFKAFFVKSLIELRLKKSDLVLIDIPLGLPSRKNTFRKCDLIARKILKNRACTLFSPPLIEALNKKTYKKALEVNRKYASVGISKQSYNLKNKIIEARNFAFNKNNIFESHPELCFASLNKSKPLLNSKHSSSGIAKRLKLLNKYNKKLGALFSKTKEELKSLKVSDDDIVDSFVLCATAIRIKTNMRNLVVLPDINEYDKKGLSLNIIYATF